MNNFPASQPTPLPRKCLAGVLAGLAFRSSLPPEHVELSGITTDSRQAKPGFLFAALPGITVDGHDFIEQAITAGCSVIMAETGRINARTATSIKARAVLVEVDDSRTALGYMAATYFDHPADKLHLVGITGTNGKTTTTYLIESILETAGINCGVIGTINYRYRDSNGKRHEIQAPFTTPDPLTLQNNLAEMVEAGVSHVVMEVSSHALEQKRAAGLLFDIAAFTNLSRDHLDFHGNMEQYFSSKKILFQQHLKADGNAIIMVESSRETQLAAAPGYGRRLAADLGILTVAKTENSRPRLFTTGFEKECDYFPLTHAFSIEGTSASIMTPAGKLAIKSPLVGDFNLRNLLTAVAISSTLGCNVEAIEKGLARVTSVPGRLERVGLQNPPATAPAVFVDYAHTPDALENVLQTLRQLSPKRLVCVFGCGGDRDQGKRLLMGEVAGRHADIVLATSDNPRSEDPRAILAAVEKGLRKSAIPRGRAIELIAGNAKGYDIIVSRRRAIGLAIRYAKTGDIILISGKGHETYQLSRAGKHYFDDRLEARKQLAAEITAPPAWHLEQVLLATGAVKITNNSHATLFNRICTDTRTIVQGDLFVALTGERFDGHSFVAEALAKGAGGILTEKPLPPEWQPGVPVLLVRDTLKALGDLAAFRRQTMPALKTIGITGSSGKTTVKEMTAAILANRHRIIKTSGNFNNLIGLPLSLLPVEKNHEFAVLEMGMNAPGEIKRLAEIAGPDIGCITNIQEAHLEGLGDINGVAAAKGELFAGVDPGGQLAVNLDDPLVRRQAAMHSLPRITFAMTRAGRRLQPTMKATHIANIENKGLRFTLHAGAEKIRVTLSCLGRHNVANGLAAAAICHGLGLTIDEIAAGLTAFRPYDKRSQQVEHPAGLHILNDSYNANPGSMKAALETVAGLKPGRRAALLGDMLELGKTSTAAHRQIGETAARLGFDFLGAIGAFAGETIGAAIDNGLTPDTAKVFSTRQALAAWVNDLIAAGLLAAGDWLLIKGSRGMRMEEVLTLLLESARPGSQRTPTP